MCPRGGVDNLSVLPQSLFGAICVQFLTSNLAVLDFDSLNYVSHTFGGSSQLLLQDTLLVCQFCEVDLVGISRNSQ